MRKIFLLIVLTNLTHQICTSQNIRIAAAGHLKLVLNEINIKYKKQHNSISFSVNYSPSGTLFQQINNGAEFDIFISAENKYPSMLEKNKLTEGSPKTYSYGEIALWSKKINIKEKGIQFLKDISIKKIAIPKPQVAPYGAKAIEILNYYKIFNDIQSKIIYAENSSQAMQYVLTGNADVAFLPLSFVYVPDNNNKGFYINFDEKTHGSIEHQFVKLKYSKNKKEIEEYFNYILSNEAKEIFKKFGYKVP